MIPIVYIRSSFLGSWDYCQHNFFITNVLGHSTSVNHRAELGTVCHKCLECIALCQKQFQQGKVQAVFREDETGIEIDIENTEFYRPTPLSNEQIDKINYSRRSKNNYLPQHQLTYGHIRYGCDFVDYLINQVYDYYSQRSKNVWVNIDRKTVWNWVWMALENNNRIYDPRNHKIWATEIFFDFPLEYDWATYEYNGSLEQIGVKGTIDLVLEHDNDTLEICDWKSGPAKNWATNTLKDYNTLHHDKQLILYYYCARKLWPDKTILITINVTT